MNPPSEDIKDIITQSGGAGTFGANVFIRNEPSRPDDCVTIYDTGGFPADLATDLYLPTVQIRVRGRVGGYKTAWEKAKLIKDILHGIHNEVWNATRYLLISAMGDILNIGKDDRGRPVFTLNLSTMRTSQILTFGDEELTFGEERIEF